MDVFSPEKRSKVMKRIHSKNTEPEKKVRSFLRANGIGYRINMKGLPGTPDIVSTRHKTAIFVNGCFWHGHDGCKYFVVPSTKREWWLEKIKRTRQRDETVEAKLLEMGWNVIIVWECDLTKNPDARLHALLKELLDHHVQLS